MIFALVGVSCHYQPYVRQCLACFWVPSTLFVIFNLQLLGAKRSNTDIKEAVNVYSHHSGLTTVLLYGIKSRWDTSEVTNMSDLFKDMKDFNDDISQWNVSNVTNMQGMFMVPL